ncbi:MAG: SDR family oxidoreductase [Alphaproteobacteria bacterium]|nr:SDR family oxidoreductase [Alphaproteobacteria bacterium]
MNALITGSSRGIGAAIAVRLARYGGRIVINYLRNQAAAEAVAQRVSDAGAEPVLVQADVRNPRDLELLAGQLDRVDALIHNAAIGVLKPFDKIRPSHWDLTLESSARPFWLLTRLCVDRLPRGASVIGLSSLGGRSYVPGYVAMGAAKGAMEAMTRQLAVELAPRGVRVNTVCGGLVDTDALDHFPDRDRMVAAARELTPFGRLGTADDIAQAVELLLLPQASWITGQVIVADGGLSIV